MRNRAQIACLTVALVLAAVACVFPPWKVTRIDSDEHSTRIRFCPLWAPPVLHFDETMLLPDSPHGRLSPTGGIALDVLAVECLAVIAATGAAAVVFGIVAVGASERKEPK